MANDALQRKFISQPSRNNILCALNSKDSCTSSVSRAYGCEGCIHTTVRVRKGNLAEPTFKASKAPWQVLFIYYVYHAADR